MSAPRVCILAAGKGTRLGAATVDLPKSLLEVAGRPILDWQIDALHACGLTDNDLSIVTGHAAEQFRIRYGQRFRLIHNEHYADFNNIYSVHLLADHAPTDLLLINGDTLFDHRILASLLESTEAAALVIDDTKPLAEEEMKTLYRDGRLERIGKDLDPATATGEYIGVLRFRGSPLTFFYEALSAMISEGRTDEWYESAIGRMAPSVRVGMSQTRAMPWIEIDTPEDADAAARLTMHMDTPPTAGRTPAR